MKQKLALLFFALLLVFAKSFGQVNLQTGSAVFSLPMFNWQDHKSKLNSLVALSYNSGSGLKVSDVASNVGQGWSLVAGGVITRMQVGEPDDQVKRDGNGTDQDVTKYPSGILYATTPASNGCPVALTKYPIYGSMNQVYTQHNVVAEDRQLDYFSFQFNGKAGQFVLDPSNIGVAVSLGDTKMKITFQEDASMISQGIRTKITSFSIQDVDGLIYKFTIHGLTKVMRAAYCDASLNYQQTQPKFENGGVYHMAEFDDALIANPYVISSWYLSEVEDALTHRKIYFYYADRNINSNAGVDISYNAEKGYAILSHKKGVSQSVALSAIAYPDGHNVAFKYGDPRVDLIGDSVLSSVTITYQGRPLSKYLFKSSYFILNRYGTPVSDYQKSVARLCLRSIQKIGVDLKEDTPPYIFDYYTGSNTSDDFIPPPFFYAKDIWGFYNGNYSRAFDNNTIPLNTNVSAFTDVNTLSGLCFMHTGISGVYLNANPGYAKNGLMKQIIYPTGGTIAYQYDQNTGTLSGPNSYIGGVHVSATSSTDGGSSNGCNNPIITQYNYVLEGGSVSSLWGYEMPVNSMITYSHYAPEYKSYHLTLSSAPFGECYWHYLYPGILSQQQAISLTEFQQRMNDLAPIFGALSIISTISDVATLIGAYSPGFGTIAAVGVDVICGLLTVALTCIGDQSRDQTANIFYNYDLNAISPLPTQFKRVEITESPGAIGKTIQEFTSVDDYPYWQQTNPAFSAKQRFAPWAYGLPKKTTIRNSSNAIIRETVNTYSYNDILIVPGCNTHPGAPNPCPLKIQVPLSLTSAKCLVLKTYSQRNTTWSNPSASYQTSSISDMAVDIYGLYTGRLELTSTSEKVYNPTDANQFVETVTSYQYNLTNYLVNSTTTTQSDGMPYTQDIKYSDDFNTGVLATLVQNNIIGIPVATLKSKMNLVLSEKVNEYVQVNNGDIRPLRSIEQRFAQPVSIVGFQEYQGPGNPSNPPYKQTQLLTYDANSNLSSVKDEGGRQIGNIYDYDDKYVVASVINTDPTADFPAYTSFETTGFGGWSLSGGSASYSTTSAMTGSRSFLLSGRTLSRTINTAKPYTLSFWAANSSVIVTGGATLIKSAPVISGFTYYEYDIAQGTSSVSVSGNSTIDELRLYPKTARMSSVAFDPLIGKTTECDPNNRLTYYEYDNLGRLRFIKDDNKNILKMYEYNNVSAAKQNGCPGLYYNHLVSETFTRYNCGATFLGGPVTYNVAANTFSSTISQADADAQAEAYLLNNGQTTANSTGACIQLYYNTIQSQNFTSESCGPGYVGGTVAYTVPANRYSSTVSVTDANQLALKEIAANGQAYANSVYTRVCNVSTAPQWEWLEGAPSYCLSVNGNLPPHLFVQQTDINPNSPTYNQTQWWDSGPQNACPAGNYYNSQQSQVFTRTNCGIGYTGGSITYTVPAGTYSSTVSQAAANQLAINDINANGQNYANINAPCNPVYQFTACCNWVCPYNTFSTPGGGIVNFTIVLYPQSGSGTSGQIGTLTGAAVLPSGMRIVNCTYNGQAYTLTFYSTGAVDISGPTVTGSIQLTQSYTQ